MDQFIANLFGPVILVTILLIGFAKMSGTKPQSLIKPFFGFLGLIVSSLFNLFVLGIKLVTHGGGSDYMRPKPLKFPNDEKPGDDDDDPPTVKVVISKD
jgi:hypothetical protein